MFSFQGTFFQNFQIDQILPKYVPGHGGGGGKIIPDQKSHFKAAFKCILQMHDMI